ncbi:MAG: SRPBCC domain-containing protein [Niabella sp.]
MLQNEPIQICVLVNADIEKAWEAFVSPSHITGWNFASDDWQCPEATNDLCVGGKFSYRMEAKDGSMGFDFGGIYLIAIPLEKIEYKLEDGRNVSVSFEKTGNNQTLVTEVFEAEQINSKELQQAGWQAILNNFKQYTETL